MVRIVRASDESCAVTEHLGRLRESTPHTPKEAVLEAEASTENPDRIVFQRKTSNAGVRRGTEEGRGCPASPVPALPPVGAQLLPGDPR